METRAKYNLPIDARIFCFLGRFHKAKGLLRLLDVVATYVARTGDEKIVLLLIGRDDGFERAAREYAKEINISPFVRIISDVYAERFNFYFSSDLFMAFPTIYEETMLASVEALSCGTPVLLSREADAPYLEELNAGRVIDFTVEAAVGALTDMLSNLGTFQAGAVAAA